MNFRRKDTSNGANYSLNLDHTRIPVHLYCTIALHFETVLVRILNVLVPFSALGQRNAIYSFTMREPTLLPLNEKAKDNFPPTYNGPKPHPFPQQTLSSIYWRVPELQSSLPQVAANIIGTVSGGSP